MDTRSRSTLDITTVNEPPSASVDLLMETTTFIRVETPKSAIRRAPKSLPDLTRLSPNSRENNIAAPSPSKLGQIILEFGADRAITEAPYFMRRLVEPCIIREVNSLPQDNGKRRVCGFGETDDALSKDDKDILMNDFQTAVKHQMPEVIKACVKKFALCDFSYVQQLCPECIPVPVLLAVYDLKARNSLRKGKYHTITLTEDEYFCERCGFVKMAQCKECSNIWCVNGQCLDDKKPDETICLLNPYCETCHLPMQSNTFLSLKRGYCHCSEECF